MPPLPYEVAEADRAFLPEGIATGFGRVWVSTGRGSVVSIDPATGEVLEVASDPKVILGGVTAGAGSVWAWNAFEPPEAEVWRISPESGELERISVPATVIDAAAGSAGLYVLHAETGEVSLVGAVDRLQGPVEGAIPVGTVGERATAIAVQDPTVYVAAASGNIYAIDRGSGDLTLLTRVGGEPTALGAPADALWVAAADGTVTEVALDREVAPAPSATDDIQTIPLDSTPDQIAVGEGGVWVTTEEAVVRVDPAGGKVVARIDLGEADGAIPGGGQGVAVGFGSVWVANPVFTDDDPRFPHGSTGGVARIDPATNRAVDAVVFTDRTPTRVAVGEGAVWLTTGDTVTRLDPQTLETEATISVEWAPPGDGVQIIADRAVDIAAGEGAIWVAVGSEPPSPGGVIARIDPATNEVVAHIELGPNPTSIAAGEGAVWVTTGEPGQGTLLRVDPTTNTVVSRTHITELGDPVAVGAGFVWIAYFEFGEGGLRQVDPGTGEPVRSIPLGIDPSDVVVGEDAVSVWVPAPFENALVRIRIQ